MSNDYKSILKRLMDRIDDSIDKRQGSIIYDALAPAALELAQCYADLEIYKEQTYLGTATGDNLDNRVADYGLTREDATNAIRIVTTRNNDNELYDVDIGDRFSIPEDSGGYNFQLIERISLGRYKAKCETAGSVGNDYLGVLLPIYNVKNLGRAEIVGTFEAGENVESDEHLRARALAKLNKDAFGGNVADYKRYMDGIDGVGKVKIFPIWNGGGTVKVVFLNSDGTSPSQEFVNEVQTLIDPVQNAGEGLGIAPVGHTVTVAGPTVETIPVYVKITLESGYDDTATVTSQVKEKIAEYFAEIQERWENSEELEIYRAKISAAALMVTGVANVTQVKINNVNSDYTVSITAANTKYPKLGEVEVSFN